MDVTTSISVERNEGRFEIEIRARVNTTYIPGSWFSPAEGGEVEILSASYEGEAVELSETEMEEAEEAVHEIAEDLRWDAGPEREDY